MQASKEIIELLNRSLRPVYDTAYMVIAIPYILLAADVGRLSKNRS